MKINSKCFFRVARQIMASYLSQRHNVDQCPSCNSDNIALCDRDGDWQRYICNDCGCDFGSVKNGYNDYQVIDDQFDFDELTSPTPESDWIDDIDKDF